jgi:hypothetical protein
MNPLTSGDEVKYQEWKLMKTDIASLSDSHSHVAFVESGMNVDILTSQ